MAVEHQAQRAHQQIFSGSAYASLHEPALDAAGAASGGAGMQGREGHRHRPALLQAGQEGRFAARH